MTPLEVMETWFQRVWKEEDTSAIDELFVPDGRAMGLGANVLIGPEGFKQFHARLLGIISSVQVSVDKVIHSDDWSAAVCTLRATSRANGRPAVMTGSVMVRIADGKIMEAYNHWDFLGLFTQLELLPSGSFETALGGAKVI